MPLLADEVEVVEVEGFEVLIEPTRPPTERDAVCVNSVIKVTRRTAKPTIHLGLNIERPISLNDMSDLDSDEKAMVIAKQKKKQEGRALSEAHE